MAPAQRSGRLPAWLLVFGFALLGPGAVPAAASPAQQATEPAYNYEHVDTYENEPWELTAGRIGLVGDISSTPDGTVYILDLRHNAVHAQAPDGRPLRVWRLPNAPDNPSEIDKLVLRWTAKRLDAGFDGMVYVLYEGLYIDRDTNRALYRNRVDRLRPTGEVAFSFTWQPESFPDPRQGRYYDLAHRSDGRIYLARSATNAFIQFTGCDPAPGEAEIVDSGLDVFSPDGDYQETIDFYTHGSVPFGVDVDKDGTIYAINTVPGVLYNPYCGPQPTELPSGMDPRDESQSADDRAAGLDQQRPASWAKNGVVIFRPDHVFLDLVEFFNAEDIAVGPAGVFVSRNVEIFNLYDPVPMYTGPPGQIYGAYFGDIVLYVDASVESWVHGGTQHCYWQGALTFEQPSARPDIPRFGGLGTDAPELEGPAYPDRIAAGDELAVLLGRYNTIGARPNQRYQGVSALLLPQTVQLWNRHGQVLAGDPPLQKSQIGLCAGGRTWYTRDVAIDEGAVYSVDFAILQRRPDINFPEWNAFPGLIEDPEAPSQLSAISADGGLVAVLDEGVGKVYIVNDKGATQATWQVDAGGNSIPVDIALQGDRVYLADRGSNRILVRDLSGNKLGDWSTHDGPESLAVGPSGDVFVLGRGHWGYRYSPTGQLLASWPMPDREIWSLDMAVDDDGKVYVSFLAHQEIPDSTLPSYVTNQFDILRSGIWIFEAKAYERVAVPPPAPDACTASPDKWATPPRIWLGETVDVMLTVEGRCPGKHQPADVAIVFDTSRSMSFDDGLERAKNASRSLLAELDSATSQAALITFDEGATKAQPLTANLASVALQIGSLEALGDTRSTAGISVGHRELVDNGRPGVRKILLLVTDGALKDNPIADAEAARLDGVEIYILVTPTREYQLQHRQQLEMMTGDASHIFVEPDPTEIVSLAHGLTQYRDTDGLFDTITIVDEIPANMRYVANTAKPTAVFDPTANTLTWTFAGVMAIQKLEMFYTLRPLEPGIWPTNVQATADYQDALGNPGRLVFPIPMVEVLVSDSRPGLIYLPFLAKQKCFPVERPLDIVLILDTSSSMQEPAQGSNGTKLDAARAAAAAFVENLTLGPRRDQAALAWFNSGSGVEVGLTDDKAALLTGLARIDWSPGTRIDLGLAAAGQALDGSSRADAKPVLILLTDGIHHDSPKGDQDVYDRAAELKARGALIYTIGLGQEIQEDLLRAVATTPEGYFPSPSTQDLADIYAQITEQIPCDLQGRLPDPVVLP
jgi:Mg-chelatase subunit ChlD/DNA-binding beta-propeller fold protein YncE